MPARSTCWPRAGVATRVSAAAAPIRNVRAVIIRPPVAGNIPLHRTIRAWLWVVSERSSLSRRPIEFNGNEVVAVGHLDRGQRRRIEDGVLVDHFVEKQHVGRGGVNLVR